MILFVSEQSKYQESWRLLFDMDHHHVVCLVLRYLERTGCKSQKQDMSCSFRKNYLWHKFILIFVWIQRASPQSQFDDIFKSQVWYLWYLFWYLGRFTIRILSWVLCWIAKDNKWNHNICAFQCHPKAFKTFKHSVDCFYPQETVDYVNKCWKFIYSNPSVRADIQVVGNMLLSKKSQLLKFYQCSDQNILMNWC